MQHKYRETLLFFATEAQYCHSFCTYCFRWAQFTAVGSNQQFASKDSKKLRDYLRANRYADVVAKMRPPPAFRPAAPRC